MMETRTGVKIQDVRKSRGKYGFIGKVSPSDVKQKANQSSFDGILQNDVPVERGGLARVWERFSNNGRTEPALLQSKMKHEGVPI